MIHLEVRETGQRLRIERELWITRNRNGLVITPHRVKALGVGDGTQVWSLGDLEGCPEARIITLAEFCETIPQEESDPELSAQEALEIIMGGME
jgi:hypothetical protein